MKTFPTPPASRAYDVYLDTDTRFGVSLVIASSLVGLDPADVEAAIEEAGWCGASVCSRHAVIVEAGDKLPDEAARYWWS